MKTKNQPLIAEEKIVPIADVEPWEKNPRGIMEKDFKRLKSQILKLGVYKRLLVYKKNGKYIVLGENMRLRALKDLGQESVAVSIINPKSEAEKIQYSLSDNDRVGYYEDQILAELVYPYRKDIIMEDFRVDISAPVDLKTVVDGFGPDGVEEPEFMSESDRRTISVICRSDDELLEMRDLLGLSAKKSNAIEAVDLKAIIKKEKDD